MTIASFTATAAVAVISLVVRVSVQVMPHSRSRCVWVMSVGRPRRAAYGEIHNELAKGEAADVTLHLGLG